MQMQQCSSSGENPDLTEWACHDIVYPCDIYRTNAVACTIRNLLDLVLDLASSEGSGRIRSFVVCLDWDAG